jgi:glucose-1-phosphate cytidylyltransferase
MTSEVTAILLCGGKGERLKPFTDTRPKPLIPLGGKPLLYHLMRHLAAAGVRRFVLCVGYKAEAIEQFAREEADKDWRIECVNSGDAAMADRVIDARPFVPGPALICYGDTLANVDVQSLRRHHQQSGGLATVSVYPLESPFGIVNVEEPSGHVTGLAEKPRLPYWINIGFVYCEPAALDALERGSDLVHFLSTLAQRRQLSAYKHPGKHLTVNTEKERVSAEQEMVSFFTVLEGHHL